MSARSQGRGRAPAVCRRVGSVDDFPVGQMRVLDIDGRSIGVVWTGERFFAVLNICPHELAPVCEGALAGTMRPCEPGNPVYALDRQILRCPWHGYEFDLSNGGRAMCRDYQGRLRLFEVIVEDGQVYVELRGSRR